MKLLLFDQNLSPGNQKDSDKQARHCLSFYEIFCLRNVAQSI
jgi:hypothetical protein